MVGNCYVELSYPIGVERPDIDLVKDKVDKLHLARRYILDNYEKPGFGDVLLSMRLLGAGNWSRFLVYIGTGDDRRFCKVMKEFIDRVGAPSIIDEDSHEGLTEQVLNDLGYTAKPSILSRLPGFGGLFKKRRLRSLETGNPVYAQV